MIRFIFFDLGGVVVKDFSSSNKWDLLRHDLGISDNYADAFNSIWKIHEKEICTTTSVDSMIPILEKECKVILPKDQPLLENFIKYFEKNETIWNVIDRVRVNFGIGLLTSMYRGMFEGIVAKRILPQVTWDVVVDSSMVGYAKPDKKIYQIAEEQSGVEKNEILFIDNSSVNIEAAKEFGWQTYFYDSSDYETSSQDLSAFLKKIS